MPYADRRVSLPYLQQSFTQYQAAMHRGVTGGRSCHRTDRHLQGTVFRVDGTPVSYRWHRSRTDRYTRAAGVASQPRSGRDHPGQQSHRGRGGNGVVHRRTAQGIQCGDITDRPRCSRWRRAGIRGRWHTQPRIQWTTGVKEIVMTDATDLVNPAFVTTNEELNALCSKWRDLPVLALDTEFIRVDTFYPKLGLIQVCDGIASYLLDPLKLTDWQAFINLLSSHSVTKVFHSCSEDLVVFAELFHQVPYPLFDTQKAAAFLGMGYSVSYQNLVKQILDIDVEKGETRSDWLQRPLSQQQITYAALDVAYLPQIVTILREQLQQRGYLEWFEAECRDMVTLASANIQQDDWHDYYLNMGAAWRLDDSQLGALQRLC